MGQKILGLSFDFDGCLFHLGYHRSNKKDVVAQNKKFLEGIKEEFKRYNKIVAYIGSNRQDKDIDSFNADRNKTASCFSSLQAICEFLGVRVDLDKILMADIYGELDAGESFERAIGDSDFQKKNGYHRHWKFDEEKLTILHTQMHKLATENPDADIDFKFFDDKYDILSALREYFNKYPCMIPDKVKLHLYRYRGKEASFVSTIQGAGAIDRQYRETIGHMAHIAIANDPEKDKRPQIIHAVRHVTPENLAARRKFQALHKCFNELIQALNGCSGDGIFENDKLFTTVDAFVKQLKSDPYVLNDTGCVADELYGKNIFDYCVDREIKSQQRNLTQRQILILRSLIGMVLLYNDIEKVFEDLCGYVSDEYFGELKNGILEGTKSFIRKKDYEPRAIKEYDKFCNDQIRKAHEAFKNQQTITTKLANIAVAITGIGLIAMLIRKLVTRNNTINTYSFFMSKFSMGLIKAVNSTKKLQETAPIFNKAIRSI